MTPLVAEITVTDIAIWYKHVDSRALREVLESLEPEEEITLSVDGEPGRWCRMRTGKDGRRVNAIRPIGAMRQRWGRLFRERRGASVALATVPAADEILAATSALFSEWESPEDEAAFGDL